MLYPLELFCHFALFICKQIKKMAKINWKEEKENLERLINIEHVPFIRIAELYGLKDGNNIKRVALSLGINVEERKPWDIYESDNIVYTCKYCGQSFTNKFKLGGHVTHCKDNPNFEHNSQTINTARKHIDKGNLSGHELCQCRYCGKEVHGNGCLAIHEKSCQSNPNREKNPNRKGNGGSSAGHTIWNKGKTMLTDERVLKYVTTKKQRISDGIIKITPHKHTDETKRILREKMIEYIKTNGNGEFGQHFSKRGCEFINELNEKNGWNLQHALNGGEKQVCGYFLDGYDEELNIAFEYDESYHYKDVVNNVLNEKDIARQNLIKEELNCTFYRYNETIGKLYQV